MPEGDVEREPRRPPSGEQTWPAPSAHVFSLATSASSPTPRSREVFEALSQQHDVFIDQIIPVGVRWGERIEAEIRQANVFIAFLSADSICSEMVVAEISTAYQLTNPKVDAQSFCPYASPTESRSRTL